ncbi:MAG: hypothetical protein HYT31_03490 [Parcubacteria group bacterium]|nr:hypothetical protein [Parcubacteria group bacterium]
MVPPIQSTQDILFYVLAAVALVVGFFLAWSLYYLALSLRDARRVTRDVRARVEALWELIELAREKLQVGSAVFKLAAGGIKELAEYVRQYTERAAAPKKRAKKSESRE